MDRDPHSKIIINLLSLFMSIHVIIDLKCGKIININRSVETLSCTIMAGY